MRNSKFVAINFIKCDEYYRSRFEELFRTRVHAIDRVEGFKYMEVLKPNENGDYYLIVSHWDNEESFKAWKGSVEFFEGHKRGFEDIKRARAEGRKPPISSNFKTYTIIAD
jgi:heme-degrading monooxygenase HmoA